MKQQYMPTSLLSYAAKSVPPESVCTSDQIGENDQDQRWISFKLVCSCGCETFEVLYFKEYDVDYCTDPYTTVCTKCKQKHLLFDSRQHGYDGQFSELRNSSGARVGEEIFWSCPRCSSPGIIAVTYEYSIDPEELSDLDINPNESFSWFIINHICTTDGGIQQIGEIETA